MATENTAQPQHDEAPTPTASSGANEGTAELARFLQARSDVVQEPPKTVDKDDGPVSDSDFLDAARYHSSQLPDLIAKGANLDARTESGDTVLHILVQNSLDQEVLKIVLKALTQAQLDALNNRGLSALFLAIEKKSTGIARTLLEHKASPSIEGESFPPLNYALRERNEEAVRLLLEYNPPLDTVDKVYKHTPLEHAIRQRNLPIISLLLDKGADINAPGSVNGRTPLITACFWEFQDGVELLITRRADVNAAGSDGITPLHTACRWNNIKILKLLLSVKAAPGVPDNKSRTALYWAAGYSQTPVIELLLRQNDIDVNARNSNGRTPLHKAIRKRRVQTVDLLIAAGADLNAADATGQTPLIAAVTRGSDQILEKLLGQKGIDSDLAEKEGCVPLMLLSAAGKDEAVRALIWRKVNVEASNHAGSTALHMACAFGRLDVVKILLQHGKADPAKLDATGQTALHKASKAGDHDIVEQLLAAIKDSDTVNKADKNGWTALHYACCGPASDIYDLDDDTFGELVMKIANNSGNDRDSRLGPHSYEKTVELLLAQGANPTLKTLNTLEKPLHIAAGSKVYNKNIVELLLGKMDIADVLSTNAAGETALVLLAKKLGSPTMPPAPEHSADDNVRRTLVWAAENRETHVFVRPLVKNGKRAAAAAELCPFPSEEQRHWNALSWAAYTGIGPVVWQLLCNMEQTPENDRSREEALKIADKVRACLEKGTTVRGSTGDDSKDFGFLDTASGMVKEKDAKDAVDPNIPKIKDYERTIDLLRDPPFVPTSAPAEVYEKPVPKAVMSKFDAVIADFYTENGRTGFLRRVRPVNKVICEEGPGKIMAEARDWINRTRSELNYRPESTGESVSQPAAGADKFEFHFRWVHLPANTLQWMSDLVYMIGSEEKREGGMSEVMSFFKKGWQEIPHGSSKSRLMKPGYVHETTPWACNSGEADVMSALYMPYIRFGRFQKEGDGDSRYKDLMNAYKDQTIHGTRTLDEFYYHTAGDERLERDMERRNQDQVVTKELEGDVKKLALPSWTILRIDELWVWVLNKQTIITSSTHRPDQVESLAAIILKELGKAPEASGGKSRPQPKTAHAMGQFIVDSCVSFYTTRTSEEAQQPADSSTSTSVSKFLSTHQIFSDAINKAAIQEADLFESFTKDNLKHQTEKGHMTNEKRSSKISATADLLCLIKDIRDELRIIRALASYQKGVQEMLLGRGPDVQRSADFIIKEIDEMDRLARGVHSAVNATLTLQQSETAISQSNEAVQQGRTLMVFTVTTILFLPMSFFTSLFAVNISIFQHDDKGELAYSPSWIFPIMLGISLPIWVGCLLYAYWANLRLPSWIRPPASGNTSKAKSGVDDEAYTTAASGGLLQVLQAVRRSGRTGTGTVNMELRDKGWTAIASRAGEGEDAKVGLLDGDGEGGKKAGNKWGNGKTGLRGLDNLRREFVSITLLRRKRRKLPLAGDEEKG
ncbi:ankyrin-3 [Naviculisporaceae sp. PSN 640]